MRRYKSKKLANFDICQHCYENSKQEGCTDSADFFLVENATDEDILHEYHKCDMCSIEPIWGLRFKCNTCADDVGVDLCENCFDKRLKMINDVDALEQERAHDI